MGMQDQDILTEMLTVQSRLEREVKRLSTRDAAGGYWVSMPPYSGVGGPVGNAAFTATTTLSILAVPRALSVKALVIVANTATTNNSGNHWNAQVINAASAALLAQQSLEADTVGVWTTHIYPASSWATPDIAMTDVFMQLKFIKIGSPGGLSLATPMLFFI